MVKRSVPGNIIRRALAVVLAGTLTVFLFLAVRLRQKNRKNSVSLTSTVMNYLRMC